MNNSVNGSFYFAFLKNNLCTVILSNKLFEDNKMTNWFEIFKAGNHTPANGITKEFTVEDCQKIVDNYNSNIDKHEAPIVIGHPKDNDPAFGWIEKLKLVGDTILAKPKQVVKEFADAVKQGLYKKRSISLYPDLTLRHVGFLGAVPPAVKGLADLKFNDSESPIVFEFNEDTPDSEKARLFNQIIELQEKVISANETLLKLNDYEKDNQKLKSDLQFAEISKIQAEENLNQLSLKIRKLEFQQYLNEKLAYGSLTPAQMEKVSSLLEALDTVDLKEGENKEKVFEFSDGKKANPITLFKEFIELLPKQIPDINKNANKENQSEIENFSEDLKLADKIAKAINNN